MGDGGERHVRRKRYRGSHPRSFAEKYKERDPETYAGEAEKVMARGGTPAGSHRPICVEEILSLLSPRSGETAVDATLGHGGHARPMLARLAPGGRLVGLDRDPVELARTADRLRAAGAAGVAAGQAGAAGHASAAGYASDALIPVHASFAELPAVLARLGIGGVDLLLADLGVSSMQIDDPARGFSWKRNGPLDMRMDQGSGPSAREWLRGVGEESLGRILRENADEAEAELVARAIQLRRGRLESTRDLAEAIASAFPDLAWGDATLTRVLRRAFQAIRIEVNGEFRALESLLAALPACLNPGGRVAILCFHSGEDRRVEAAFARGLGEGIYAVASTEPIRPGPEERRSNPRSSSAKLRWARRA